MRSLATALILLVAMAYAEPVHAEIAFTSDRTGTRQVYLVRAAGGEPRALTDRPDGGGVPAWHPSGTKLISRGLDGATLIHLDRQGESSIVAGFHPAWSPDGKRIAGSVYHPTRSPDTTLVILEADSGAIQLVATEIAYVASPRSAWSPDGAKLVYGGYRIDVQTGEISEFLKDRTLVLNPGSADWSPDGSLIAVGSVGDILLIDAVTGHTVRQLERHPSTNTGPTWSPDGARLAFSSDRDGNREVYTIGRDGSNLRNMTTHPATDWQPDWSPIPDDGPGVHHFGKLLFAWGFLRGFGPVR